MEQSILNWLDAQQPEMARILPLWCNVNSGSFNAAGVNAVGEMIAEYIQSNLKVRSERIKVAPVAVVSERGEIEHKPVGDLWRFYKAKSPANPSIKLLLTGHLDTVFPKDSSFQHCTMLEDGVMGGPGVADMKGGILLMLNALQAIEKSSIADQVDWQILLNPDEEIGSHSSAQYLALAAQDAQIGMVFEPSMPNGDLAGARKGSGNFSLIVDGKAAHAGREFELGRNAISALALAMLELERVNSSGHNITLNLGKIHGGGPVNIVPDKAICHFNVRVTSQAEADIAQQHIDSVVAAVNAREGFKAQLVGHFTRPAKPATPQQEKLFELVSHCGQELGLNIQFKPTGGCCDGNNLAAAGLPNVDSLGVQGGNIHSHQEYVQLDSLATRAKLSALVITRLATEKTKWVV